MTRDLPEFEYYPTETEVDAWLEEIWQQASETDCKAEPLPSLSQ